MNSNSAGNDPTPAPDLASDHEVLKPHRNIWLPALVAALLVTNAVTAFLYFRSGSETTLSDRNTGAKSDRDEIPAINDQSSISSDTDQALPSEETQDPIDDIIATTTGSDIKIAWYEWKKERNMYEVFGDMGGVKMESGGKIDRIYEVGHIDEEQPVIKKLRSLLILTFLPDGPYSRPFMYRFIEDNGTSTVLSRYSDPIEYLDPGLAAKFNATSDVIIENIETPDRILTVADRPPLQKASSEPFQDKESFKVVSRVVEYENGKWLYQTDDGCFMAVAPDGTARLYYYRWPFTRSGTESTLDSELSNIELDLIAPDGHAVKGEYTWRRFGGCGASGCYSSAEMLGPDPVLETLGKVSNEYLYYPKIGDILTKYQKEYQDIYEFYYPGWDQTAQQSKSKVSFEEFIADYPIIFWRDPFGNYVRFQSVKYQPAVECGKPVIYLYPERETEASVKVAPNGGLSVTEPAYGDGWRVRAYPNGRLVNLADQVEYPYLFWEGYGLDYTRPEDGFMVARRDLKSFLEKTLARLGLVKVEYDEFIEYWLPRMQAYPYYYITFLPQDQFDLIAPLGVEPRPDTVIRVFMDYEGLSAPRTVREPVIITPERVGFTVVEWGGAKR